MVTKAIVVFALCFFAIIPLTVFADSEVQVDGILGLNPGGYILFGDGTWQDTASHGTLTGVTAGTGLSGGGVSGNVTVSVDPTYVQRRVSASCSSGTSIRQINQDGSLDCQEVGTGTVTSVATGTGLTGGPITSAGTISLANTAVSPGAYTRANITIDAQGRITSASSGGSLNLGTDVTGTLPIANGGTGSSSKTFVDLSSNQTIAGAKTFTGDLGVPSLTMTGNLTLPDTTATAGIIRQGASPLMHTYGSYNYFAGTDAGNLTMTGNYNTASGHRVLHANTTGDHNTASGAHAMQSNTTGRWNTATGSWALTANTTGENNTAYGADTLSSNATGNWNTANGYGALNYNTIGDANTAVGNIALYYNSAGGENTALGDIVLNHNTTANKNTAVGAGSLYTQSFDNGGTPWDSSNTAVGYDTLYYNEPTSTDNGVRNTALGAYGLQHNTTGYRNTAIGYAALYGNTSGRENIALGHWAGDSWQTGDRNTFLGASSDAAAEDTTNATAIGYGAVVDASNRVRIGNASITQIGGQVAWSNLSDIRTKKDVSEIGFGLDFINSLRPVQFRMKTGDGRIDFGFIAQDIETLLGTDYSVLGIGADKDRTLSLRYNDFIAPMVKAMQEQHAIVEAQKKEIVGQNERIKTLEERLARLEASLAAR